MATANPELSAAALADLVAPPPKPTKTAIPAAEARPHAARCPECDDQHIVELPPDPINIYGTVGPCPLCRPPAPTASATPASAAGPSAGPSGRRPDAGETEPQPIRLLLEAAVTTRKVSD